MRRASTADADDLALVCLRTADSGADATALHADADLPGLVWAVPYLHAPGAVALAVDESEDDVAPSVSGYCVAVPDTAAFEDWAEAAWWPPLRARNPRGSGATPADAALVRRLHDPPRTDPAVLTDFPAHLHVDLLPRLQGRGWGRRLVEAVLVELAAAGVPGLHLGVGARNLGAQAFYDRLGFVRLTRDPAGGLVLGRRLAG